MEKEFTNNDLRFTVEVESGNRKNAFAAALVDTSNPYITKYVLDTPIIDPPWEYQGLPYRRWGANNLEPERLLTNLKRCGLVQTIIEKLVAYTVGSGIVFYEFDAKGQMVELNDSAKWLSIFNSTQGNDWLYRNTYDYWTLGNTFNKIIMNNQQKPMPALLMPITSPWCRLGQQNMETRQVEHLFISAQFKNFPWMQEGDERLSKVKLLDKYLYNYQLKQLNEKEYMIAAYNYTPGEYFYHTLPWHAQDIEEYIDVLSAFPKTEKAMFEKSMTVKYAIGVDEAYLAARMGVGDNLERFKGLPFADKQAKMQEIRSAMEECLVGAEKQHATIMIPFIYEDNGRGGENSRRPAITIEPIEDKLKKDAHIPNSQNATGKLLESFGLDPVLIGSGVLGTANSLSGGSNKREAELSLQITLNPHRNNILWPMKVYLQQFGFPVNAEIGVRNMIQVTQDLNKSGQTAAINGIQK